MPDYVEAARLHQISAGSGLSVTLAGKPIALFNVGGRIYAIDDRCPHESSALGSCKLDDRIVTGRTSGLKIDVVTGCLPGTKEFAVASYPVMVLAGRILVEIQSPRGTRETMRQREANSS